MAVFRSADYAKAIASAHWRKLKQQVIAVRGMRCERCNKTWAPGAKGTLQLHHVTYERIGQETERDVELLCGSCHESADIERAKRGKAKSAAALYDAQLDGWASKKYGEDWAEGCDYESVAEDFDRWSRDREGE